MNKQELLKHFQTPDEKLLISKVLDRLFLCQKSRQKTFTFFLDPVSVIKFSGILQKQFEENLLAYGGASVCERKILGFSPPSEKLEFRDFPIDRIVINFPLKFGSGLSHRDYLGGLTGLGINREKIGDINIDVKEAVVYSHRDVSGFICANLERVGRVAVTAKIESASGDFWENWPELKPDAGRETLLNVSSLRLDTIVGSAFSVSRGASVQLINSGKVSVNWAPVLKSDKTAAEGDIISVRGHGRIRVEKITYNAKKQRFTVCSSKYF